MSLSGFDPFIHKRLREHTSLASWPPRYLGKSRRPPQPFLNSAPASRHGVFVINVVAQTLPTMVHNFIQYLINVVAMLSQSLDDLGTTRGECLGRTRWSSLLDWTTYLYYFYKWLYTTSPWSHVLLEYSTITWLVTWYDYVNSHTIYILSLLYDLMFAIKCLNAWETFSFFGLS